MVTSNSLAALSRVWINVAQLWQHLKRRINIRSLIDPHIFYKTYSIIRFNTKFKLVVGNFPKAHGKCLIWILGDSLCQNAWVSSEQLCANKASFLAISEVPHRLVGIKSPSCRPASTQNFILYDLDKKVIINIIKYWYLILILLIYTKFNICITCCFDALLLETSLVAVVDEASFILTPSYQNCSDD